MLPECVSVQGVLANWCDEGPTCRAETCLRSMRSPLDGTPSISSLPPLTAGPHSPSDMPCKAQAPM